MQIKVRYITAALIVLASIAATPAAVKHAYEFRGQMAFGGEWLVIPLGIILALLFLEGAKVWDSFITQCKSGQETPESEE